MSNSLFGADEGDIEKRKRKSSDRKRKGLPVKVCLFLLVNKNPPSKMLLSLLPKTLSLCALLYKLYI